MTRFPNFADEGHDGGIFHSIFGCDRERVRDVFEGRARDFDGSELHLPNWKHVCTWEGEHEWVECGLVHGCVVPSRSRIKKFNDYLRWWTLPGSNDRNAALDDWVVLHHHWEGTEVEKTSEVLEFECPECHLADFATRPVACKLYGECGTGRCSVWS